MRPQAKTSTVASTERPAGGLGHTLSASVLLLGILAAAFVALALAATPAHAGKGWALKEAFGSASQPEFGSSFAMNLTVDRSSGDLLVADQGIDEEQRVTVSATAGEFRLVLGLGGFGVSETADISASASAEEVENALNAITNVSGGGGSVSVDGGPGDADGTSPYTIVFQGGLARTEVETLLCESGTTPLSGGSGCALTTPVPGRARGVKRFHPDGTPADFAALGGNVIDGKGGPDTTPLGSVLGAVGDQVAVDSSGTATDGNIYVTNTTGHVVDIFSDEGAFLGRLTAASKSGALDQPEGVGVDETGAIYVSDRHAPFTASKIHKFKSSGSFPVDSDDVATFTAHSNENLVAGVGPTDGYFFILENLAGGIEKRDSETGTKEYLVVSGGQRLAIDPDSGHVFIAQASKVTEYDASGHSGATPVAVLEDAGGGVRGVAVAKGGETLYVAHGGDAGKVKLDVYEAVPIPDPTAGPPSVLSGAKATVTGSVNPNGVSVAECFFEYGETTSYGSTAPCEGAIPVDSDDHPVTGKLSGMLANGRIYHYRLVVKGTVDQPARSGDETLVTANTYLTGPASDLSETEATLNGAVRLEGIPLSGCEFRYGPTTDYGASLPCTPDFSAVPNDDVGHTVTAAVGGLEPGGTYHYRLFAENALGQLVGADRTFTTKGLPQIVEQRPLDASQTGATLRAQINPAGAATTYHFEWGDDTSYGNRIPADHELFLGSGAEPVRVSASLTSLDPSSLYYFRVVATNSFGTTVGPDQRLETLNKYDLPGNRGIELVSPAEKGSAGSVSTLFGTDEQIIQASDDGGAIAYPIQNGIPGSTAGGWTRWRAGRTASGWLSAQISSPSLIPPLGGAGINQPSLVQLASPNLSCAIVRTHNPLTADTPPLDVELGVKNLYRWSSVDGSYDLITNRVPLNPGVNFEPVLGLGYSRVEVSDDCSRIYFHSLYEFIPGASGLYEWHEGTLRDAGVLPDGTIGAALPQNSQLGGPTGAVAGGEIHELNQATARWNAVSPDGSRLFFTARSDAGPDSGTPAVFMRSGASTGASVVDISQSQTAVPTNGARFEAASVDGSRVFFRANYGIATTTSAGPTNGACGPLGSETASTDNLPLEEKPCDLYVYEVENPSTHLPKLTDLSADANPADTAGAQIQGTVAIDEDGSHVYFAALGQLIPGKGRTYAQNVAGEGSANVYLADGSSLVYVMTLNRGTAVTGDLFGGSGVGGGSGAIMRRATRWGAETSADGSRLLFESASNLTGYDVSGGKAVYLFSADTGKVICISCRPDGGPTLVRPNGAVEAGKSTRLLSRPRAAALTDRARSMSADGSRIVFTSPDVLAPGAVAGKRNVYLWEEGQVSLLTIAKPTGGNGLGEYLDMSLDGDDVFIATAAQLLPGDKDLVSDVYDFRVGGGFLEEAPPIPCNPAADQCQGQAAPQPGATAAPSASFAGPGNPPVSKPRPKTCPKGKVRRHGKCVKKKNAGKRAANTNRGGVK